MQLELDIGNTKRCSKCKETKGTSEFGEEKNRPDGLCVWCKSCKKEYNRKRLAGLIANPPPTPTTKQCRLCKETKVAAKFYKDKNSPDGLSYTCKSCVIEENHALRLKYTRRNTLAGSPDRTGTKRCPRCGETKQKTEFHTDSSCSDGLRHNCKSCQNTRDRQWQKDNLAKVNAKTARRRARKLKATPSWEDKRKTMWYYDESQRITAETGVVHHVDHTVPLNHWSVCGLHWHMNFDVLPGAENGSKGNRFWEGDWQDYYWDFEEEFQQLKEYALWLKSLTNHARSVHLATLTTSTQLRAKATVTPVATATVTSANEGNNEKICQASA